MPRLQVAMIDIRPAGLDDLAALAALDSYAPDHQTRVDEIRRWTASGECHVATLERRPTGYIVLNRSFFQQPFIEMVMVGTAFRRRGVGRRLVDYAYAFWPDERIWASANQSNLPMQSLLLRAGFQQSGVVENLDPGDPELIFMHLPLNESWGIRT